MDLARWWANALAEAALLREVEDRIVVLALAQYCILQHGRAPALPLAFLHKLADGQEPEPADVPDVVEPPQWPR